MIITKKKHDSIVSMKNETIVHLEDLVAKKNEDIKDLEGKLEGNKKLLKDKEFELYESTQNLIARDKELGDKILNMREVNVDLQKENKEYKNQLDRVKEMLRQYKWYIDKSMEVGNASTYTLTLKDIHKFHSKEGIEGIMKLYQLAAMMQ